MLQTGPTYANTSMTMTGFGNNVYGNSNTTFGGSNMIVYGSHDSSLGVLLLKKGDSDYGRGVDAKGVLGPDWQKIAEKGINTCE